MNTLGGRGEKLYRAWAETEVVFDKDRARARFLAARSSKTRSSGARHAARELFWLSAAAMVAAAAFTLWLMPQSALTFTTPSGQGQVGAWLATDSSSQLPLSFSERTRIVLREDSRGRVEQLGQRGAHFLLERGTVHAEVVHRSGADWRFLAGPFEVLVTGTALNVAWDPQSERFTVGVDNGSIVLHGPYLGGEQGVHAGERCIVDVPSKSMRFLAADASDNAIEQVPSSADARPAALAPAAGAQEPSVAPSADGAINEASHPAQRAPSEAMWAKLEQQGDYDGAYAAALHVGTSSLYRSASADALLQLAKVGLLSGHHDLQREALLACRERFARTHQAALAAYELGRSSLGVEAAGWFETYLSEQPGGALAREAAGRLLEAQSASHNEAAARAAAKRYLARYPDGPHAALARRTLAAKPGDD